MTTPREIRIEQRVLAAVRQEPGRYRPRALILELGLRREDGLRAIRRLKDREEIAKDADGWLIPTATREMPVAGRGVARELGHGDH